MYAWNRFSPTSLNTYKGKYSCGVDTSISLSALTYRIMHAQHFDLINLNLKLQLCTKASFSLLLILLAPSSTRECYRRERKYLIENTIMLQPNISAHFWLQFYIFLI